MPRGDAVAAEPDVEGDSESRAIDPGGFDWNFADRDGSDVDITTAFPPYEE